MNYLRMLSAGRAWIALVWVVISLSAVQPLWAQDTISTDDIEFTPVDPTPAVAPTDTAKIASQSATVGTAQAATVDAVADTATPEPAKDSLWVTFLAGLVGGFAAIFMPCIFPLLPMTISFFTKQSGTRAKGIRNALIYGVSIIVIYVALGLLITVIFGADALNDLSTNGIFNFAFFLLLVVFAASFFGAFEIMLPTSWANKMDAKADQATLIGFGINLIGPARG